MENTDEHAQIPNTQHSPTHNTPYHSRRTNNPIHKQSNSIRPHILNTKHNTTNYNTQSHGHEDTKQITKIPKPIHKQQKKTVQNNYTPTATLPINPLNTISHSSYRKLQQVQNKALRFIENTKRTDRIPSTTLHTRNELKAINTYIHRRAIDAWTQLHDKNPDLYDTLKPEADELTRHTHFPTSFLTAETPEPRPIYV